MASEKSLMSMRQPEKLCFFQDQQENQEDLMDDFSIDHATSPKLIMTTQTCPKNCHYMMAPSSLGSQQ